MINKFAKINRSIDDVKNSANKNVDRIHRSAGRSVGSTNLIRTRFSFSEKENPNILLKSGWLVGRFAMDQFPNNKDTNRAEAIARVIINEARNNDFVWVIGDDREDFIALIARRVRMGVGYEKDVQIVAQYGIKSIVVTS